MIVSLIGGEEKYSTVISAISTIFGYVFVYNIALLSVLFLPYLGM